jgi:hypothetical protein
MCLLCVHYVFTLCSLCVYSVFTMCFFCRGAQEKGGPLVTDNTYVIGGEPVETVMGANSYLDTVTWESPDCLMVTK